MRKIIALIFPGLLILMGVQFTRDYFGDTTQEKRNKLEQLVAEGEEAIGILDDEYTEKTMKIAKIPITTYEVGYTFKAGDKEYSGLKILQDPPTAPTIKVKYLPSDPSVNAAGVVAELQSMTEQEESSTGLFIGLGLLLAGLGLGYFRLRSFSRSEA